MPQILPLADTINDFTYYFADLWPRAYIGQGPGHDDRLASRPVISSRVDYCDTETFRASCNSQDEVIMIDRAAYGRMRLGRCVETDMGHVGCRGSRGSDICHVAVSWVTWAVSRTSCPPPTDAVLEGPRVKSGFLTPNWKRPDPAFVNSKPTWKSRIAVSQVKKDKVDHA